LLAPFFFFFFFTKGLFAIRSFLWALTIARSGYTFCHTGRLRTACRVCTACAHLSSSRIGGHGSLPFLLLPRRPFSANCSRGAATSIGLNSRNTAPSSPSHPVLLCSRYVFGLPPSKLFQSSSAAGLSLLRCWRSLMRLLGRQRTF